MAYDVNTISNYIICREFESQRSISNLRLQKLLFYCQLNYVRKMGRPLFEEDLEAWSFGLVVPEIYNKYRIYGGGNFPFNFPLYKEELFGNAENLINEILDLCADFSNTELNEAIFHYPLWHEICYSTFDRKFTYGRIKRYFETKGK